MLNVKWFGAAFTRLKHATLSKVAVTIAAIPPRRHTILLPVAMLEPAPSGRVRMMHPALILQAGCANASTSRYVLELQNMGDSSSFVRVGARLAFHVTA